MSCETLLRWGLADVFLMMRLRDRVLLGRKSPEVKRRLLTSHCHRDVAQHVTRGEGRGQVSQWEVTPLPPVRTVLWGGPWAAHVSGWGAGLYLRWAFRVFSLSQFMYVIILIPIGLYGDFILRVKIQHCIQLLMFFQLCPLGALRWLLCPFAMPHLCVCVCVCVCDVCGVVCVCVCVCVCVR